MSGDYTRFTFKPLRDYLAVLKQQGRVDLDADFNELMEIVDRHWRSETIDIIGHCAVPTTTPQAFLVTLTGMGAFDIGIGRMYVDGIQVECHGLPPDVYLPDLGEMRGTLPIPYSNQPYLPAPLPPALTTTPFPGRTDLVYLDVWQREVTAIEDPTLREIALGGPDTATRVQAVWQVRVLQNVGRHTCGDTIPAWDELIAPSAGRLTTSALPPPASDDPCIISLSGGYRGLENRLYRVQIHTVGTVGGGAPAKFKWSRNNATVVSAVTAIPTSTQITVAQIGRDRVLRFDPGNWIEITDDYREFQGLAGHMAKITGIDEANRVITFAPAIPAAMGFDPNNPARHTRAVRWDQTKLVDANGLLNVTAGPIEIEDGVRVTFALDPANGRFKVGDYWCFAARTADGSVELLQNAPPRGILHHFCRLGFINWGTSLQNSTFTNCRPFWPPEFGERGCDCTECVSADDHNSGRLTIQMAIDRVKSKGGGKVCLGPGFFFLGATTVQISDAQWIQIEGHGWGTFLVHFGPGTAVRVADSIGVDLTSFAVLAATDRGEVIALEVQDSAFVRVERCSLMQSGAGDFNCAVGLSGYIIETSFRDNLLFGVSGILSLAGSPDGRNFDDERPMLTALFGLYIENNFVVGFDSGIRLDRLTLHFGATRVAGNSIFGSRLSSIVTRGQVALSPSGSILFGLTSSRIDIVGNEIQTFGGGIEVGTDNTRVCDNDIGVLRLRDTDVGGGDGIALVDGFSSDDLGRCLVIGNRISGVGGHGIVLRTKVDSAMIKQNIIQDVVGGGIIMDAGSAAGTLSIENNQLLEIGRSNDPATEVSAIRVYFTSEAEVASNTIQDFASQALQSPSRIGIEISSCQSVRIAGNSLMNIGPSIDFIQAGVGINVNGSFDRVDIVDNSVRRRHDMPSDPGNASWFAVRIVGGSPSPATGATGSTTLLRGPVWVLSLEDGRLLHLTNVSAAVLPRGRGIAAVRGNLLDGYGNVPEVDIAVGGACVFSDNRCTFNASSHSPGLVARIAAQALIVNANYLERLSGDGSVMRLIVNEKAFTALGNITVNGPIQVNNDLLKDPWKPLNVVL